MGMPQTGPGVASSSYILKQPPAASKQAAQLPAQATGSLRRRSAGRPASPVEMGSVVVEEDAGAKAAVEAFLERCSPSGDAAYGELRAMLERLHDPATRRAARVFLTDLRRRQSSSSSSDGSGGDFFRRFGFRIQELVLHHNLAAAFLSGGSSSPGNPSSSIIILHASYHTTTIITIRQSIGARALPMDQFIYFNLQLNC